MIRPLTKNIYYWAAQPSVIHHGYQDEFCTQVTRNKMPGGLSTALFYWLTPALIMGQNPCFVAVHCGAGFHSKTKENSYKKLIEICCNKTLKNLESTDNLVESLVLGIKELEVLHAVRTNCKKHLE